MIADKDLPDIKPTDIKIDISVVEVLSPGALATTKSRWVNTSRTNEQLVILIKQIPEKVDKITMMLEGQKEKDQALLDKIVRLKEEYAVCILEIKSRRVASVVDVG